MHVSALMEDLKMAISNVSCLPFEILTELDIEDQVSSDFGLANECSLLTLVNFKSRMNNFHFFEDRVLP
jgi:hypothetical protein